ncbi:MAG: hypothetical protein AAFZ01_04210 [Pseudomonadota bacterium]
MSNLIYEGRRYDPGVFIKTVTGLNIIVSMVFVFAWQFAALFTADAISAASGMGLSPHGRPELMESPYVFLWTTPLVASFIGWYAYKFEFKTFGRFVAIYPVALIVSCMVWYFNFSGY